MTEKGSSKFVRIFFKYVWVDILSLEHTRKFILSKVVILTSINII